MKIQGSVPQILKSINYKGDGSELLVGKPITNGFGGEQIGTIEKVEGDTWYGDIPNGVLCNTIFQCFTIQSHRDIFTGGIAISVKHCDPFRKES